MPQVDRLIDADEAVAVGAAIQRGVQASESLQRYALALWRATADPAAFGVRLPGIDMAQRMLAGASPRGMSMLLRAARVAASARIGPNIGASKGAMASAMARTSILFIGNPSGVWEFRVYQGLAKEG